MFAVHWVIISHPIPSKAALRPGSVAAQISLGLMVGAPWDVHHAPRGAAGSGGRGWARARAGGWLALWQLGPAWGLEELVPQAGGHTPHLLQGLDPLFQEPVLRPKPLCGERGGECVRSPLPLTYLKGRAASRQDGAIIKCSGSVIPEKSRGQFRSAWPTRFFFFLVNKSWFT